VEFFEEQQVKREIQFNANMKIKLPASIHECKPDQLVKWLMLAEVIKEKQNDELFQMLDFQCQLISIFSGLKVNKVKQLAIEDVQRLSGHITRILANYSYSEPLGEVTVNGQRYVFEKDFRLISTGQIIDLKLIDDVASDPVQALAICYIEEGFEYCQEDDRGRVLNPNEKRYKAFKEQFDGAEFMNFFGFFLRESKKRNDAILAIQTIRTMMNQRQAMEKLKTMNGSHGQESFSDLDKNLERLLTQSLNNRT
jgi:hypothetical protein